MLTPLPAWLGRRMPHGLVFAGLAALIAVGAAFSGAASSTDAGEASSANQTAARSSLDVVRSMLDRYADDEARADAAPRVAPVLAPSALNEPPEPAVTLSRLDASLYRSGVLGTTTRVGATHAQATPDLKPGDRVVATVSFYYCVAGVGAHPRGDGGQFCGAMRDGTVVYSGAAACDFAYIGQRFRIEGDPSRRVYTCNDTGSAVHGLHRDIWFHTSDEGWYWQLAVGPRAVIEIVR